jgi:hypothetical protein
MSKFEVAGCDLEQERRKQSNFFFLNGRSGLRGSGLADILVLFLPG